MNKDKFLELIDTEILSDLLDQIYQMAHIRVGILSYPDQELLIKTNFASLCIDFHRKHPVAGCECRESDEALAATLTSSDVITISKCKHGMSFGATPIIIEGEHLVSIFSGQVFYSEPDINYYKHRAELFGFNVDEYLKAVREVPIITEETHKSYLLFLNKLGRMLIQMGLTNKKLKESKTEISQIQSIQKALLDNIPDMAWLKDKNSSFIAINDSLCKAMGLPEVQIIGKSDLDFFPKDIAETYINKDKEVIASGKRVIVEEPFVDVSGKEIIIESIKTPIYNENNEVIGTVGIARNITERKRIEQELANSKINLEIIVEEQTSQLKDSLRKLEELNKSLLEVNNHKNKFISNMSHELRTPLNAIIGFSDLLQEEHFGAMSDLQKHYLGIIQDSANHLLNLINDILDLSKIDADTMSLEIKNVSPLEIVDPIIKMLKPQIVDKNLQLEVSIDENIPSIVADVRKSKQVLLNILSNAIKFTMNFGKIELKVEKNNNYAQFTVIDTGVGIKEEDKQNIFMEFFQSEDLKEINISGAGIGLALSKRLIQVQNGEIGFSSQLGKGSIFWFTLPLGQVTFIHGDKDKESILAETQNNKNYKILIAEDNPINLRLITDILKIHNYTFVTAKNGLEAYHLALKEKPDLMLLDIKMPVMDGLELIKKLRVIPDFIHTPIYAITASAGAEARLKHIEAGFTDQLDKPFTVKKLFELIDKK